MRYFSWVVKGSVVGVVVWMGVVEQGQEGGINGSGASGSTGEAVGDL